MGWKMKISNNRKIGIKVYVAAPWIDKDLAQAVGDLVEAANCNITHKWWLFEGQEEDASTAFKQECAELDVNGVKSADCLLLINSNKSEGKAVEQGIAIANSLPIIVIGEQKSNIFQYLPCYTWTKTNEEAIDILTQFRFCIDCRCYIGDKKLIRRCNACRQLYSANQSLRLHIMQFYSDHPRHIRCKNCGFDDIRALQLDHIYGGGAKQRKLGGGIGSYSWIKKNNYPSGYQVLCANCNWIKRVENNECNKLTKYRGKELL